MRKLKILLIFIIAFVFLFGINKTVNADLGPKSYVEIEFEVDKTYYVTLLSKKSQFGPYNVDDPTRPEVDDIDAAFSNYQDEYYYLHLYRRIDKDHNTFKWTYYPPEDFKVLIYDVDNNNFIISEGYNTYAFASIFKCELTNNKLVLTKEEQTGSEIGNLIIRMLVTLVLEIGLALLFRFRKEELLLIIVANVATQLALNIVLNITIHNEGLQTFMIMNLMVILEVLIIIVETLIYVFIIPIIDYKNGLITKSRVSIIIYTILANIVSAVLGGLILLQFPV